MKPTEADIQAELDRNGLGFELGNYRSDDGSFYLRHATCEYKIHAKLPERSFEIWTLDGMGLLREFDFDDVTSDRIVDLKPPTITVNASHWISALSLCRDLVRLITGEQVEQSLEEKVREILEPLKDVTEITIAHIRDDEVSLCNKVHQYWITSGKVIYSRDNGNVEKTLAEYAESGLYVPEFKAIAALLTAHPESEQTLEEAVNDEIAAIVEADKGIESFELDKSGVLLLTKNDAGLNGQKYEFAITPRSVNCRISSGPWKYQTLLDYLCEHPSEEWTHTVLQLAREVQRQAHSPSYSDLEQRVEDLEEGKQLLIKDCEIWKRKADELDLAYSHLDEMLEESLICHDAKDSQIENLQSANRQWSDHVREQKKELQDRITELEAQLQDYISPADHEREIANCDSLLAKVTLERDQARKDSALHLSWFHREYAKNAEASQ